MQDDHVFVVGAVGVDGEIIRSSDNRLIVDDDCFMVQQPLNSILAHGDALLSQQPRIATGGRLELAFVKYSAYAYTGGSPFEQCIRDRVVGEQESHDVDAVFCGADMGDDVFCHPVIGRKIYFYPALLILARG